MLILDHLAFAASSLEEGRTWLEEKLGLPLQAGGQHARYGTHNLLMGMEDGLYLEVIAIDPAAPAPETPRWFDLDNFTGAPRLANWIARTDTLDAMKAAMPEAGETVALARGDLAWRMAVPASGALPLHGGLPSLIQWDCEAHPAQRLTPQPLRLDALLIRHPDAAEIERRLAPLFSDQRIRFEPAAAPALSATFQTSQGRVTL